MEKFNLIYLTTILLCTNLFFIERIAATNQLNNTGTEPDLPKNCSKFTWKPEDQPKKDPNAFIRKCCPTGYGYKPESKALCVESNATMQPLPVVEARFYITDHVDCIEDLETGFNLSMRTISGKLECSSTDGRRVEALRYDYGDPEKFYILQNGSLILVDPKFEYYDVMINYCVEMDNNKLVAYACSPTEDQPALALTKLQIKITAICMFISVPCLFLTAVIYFLIPRLRNVHGETLALHSICLGIGFLLMGWINVTSFELESTINKINYSIQFLILSCFCWLLAMTIDITLNVWYFLPKTVSIKKFTKWRVSAYFLLAFGLPAIIVVSGPSQPSYYSMAQLAGVKNDSLKYFIIPICVILMTNFALFIAIYKGFREIHAISSLAYMVRRAMASNHEDNTGVVSPCNETVEEVKRTAKSAVWLFAIMTVNWIFEIITFFYEDLKVAIMVFEVLNALQGVVIFIIFVWTPHYKKIIINWWFDRGSMECPRERPVNGTEMALLNGRNNNHDAEKQ